MAKAKDYAARFNASPVEEVLGQIAIDFLVEVKDIAKQRCGEKHMLDISFFSVLNEQDQKWQAFCRLVQKGCGHVIRPDGFRYLLHKEVPFIFARWKPKPIVME